MTSIFKNAIDKLYNRLLLFNNPFYFYGIPKKDFILRQGTVRLKKLNLEFHLPAGDSIIRGYPFALKIHEAVGGWFTVDHEKVLLQIGDLRFSIHSPEELFILYEVFVTDVYRYCCLRETVFIDVGMNAASTTLYYAQQPLVKKIYAFELFEPTFVIGRQNLNLNETCSQKVEAFNVGLSNREFETTLDYSPSVKGRMGLRGLPGNQHFDDVVKQNVMVKDIVVVFNEILSRHAQEEIVVKLDCEGEEYNLIDALATSGLLEKLNVLMIEWHHVRPIEIENRLKEFDFHVFSQVLPSLDSGLIYASK